jgi:hypothetical protein
MRKKLGSLASNGDDNLNNSEKKKWSTVMEGIPEEEKESVFESAPMNLYKPNVDKEPNWKNGGLSIEVPDNYGVNFVLAKKNRFLSTESRSRAPK